MMHTGETIVAVEPIVNLVQCGTIDQRRYNESVWQRKETGMSRWGKVLVGVGVAAWLLLFALHGNGPRSGDVVTPRLAEPLFWRAGRSADITVCLEARRLDGSSARRLDFSGIPESSNPFALVRFYRGDEPLSTFRVALDHRC
jgi:hypothetical protein